MTGGTCLASPLQDLHALLLVLLVAEVAILDHHQQLVAKIAIMATRVRVIAAFPRPRRCGTLGDIKPRYCALGYASHLCEPLPHRNVALELGIHCDEVTPK